MIVLLSNRAPKGNIVTSSIYINNIQSFLMIGDFVSIGSIFNLIIGEIIDNLPIQLVPIGELNDHDHIYWSTRLNLFYNMCLVKIWQPKEKYSSYLSPLPMSEISKLEHISELIRS